MKNVISIENQFYILAHSSLAEQPTRVLKSGDIFGVFNFQGNIRPLGFENHGLFFEGTRFLSRLVMTIVSDNPLLLSSAIKDDNDLFVVDLTNPDVCLEPEDMIKRGTLHFFRTIFLQDHCCYERIRVTNYGAEAVDFSFGFEFEADFLDIFEVRGVKRPRRGRLHPPIATDRAVDLIYDGLDGITRTSRLEFSPPPTSLQPDEARFSASLQPGEQKDFFLTVLCSGRRNQNIQALSYQDALAVIHNNTQTARQNNCHIETSNSDFNNLIERSRADLFMMLTKTSYGFYPYAGIPWFSTVFGRDGLITAFETLWLYPQIAQGVLSFLAAHQAKDFDAVRDAEPGKILHEQRRGEMVNLEEIPFGRYYGSIDATPLFLILAGYYYERTHDRDLIERIWPALELALEWIDRYGDVDGDGFTEYERKENSGLLQQGWKDSDDAVFHSNGELAEAPIALCEVQGYVYEAKIQMANLAMAFDKAILGKQLLLEAKELQKKFEDRFWCEDLGTYALALDGKKRPCRVLSSNAGQCLFSGIASRKHAGRLADLLTDDAFFSGWGIRTIASTQTAYNPMSYHNGSIWPHDNALIAWGFHRYGYKKSVIKVLTGLFEAGQYLDLNRLSELYCGFIRRPGEGPTLYPVACNPQSWSSAAVFMLLQALLGLKVESESQRIYFLNPVMPEYLDEIRIANLSIGSANIDLLLKRRGEEVAINVMRQQGKVEIILSKHSE